MQKKETSDILAVLTCLAAFLFWVCLLFKKYSLFGYYDWDFALYAQAMSTLVHGSLEPSLFGINFLANHANYITFVIAPIYAIFQHPFTLIILKILSRVLSGYVLYQITKRKISGEVGLFFLLAYFLYPANIFSMLFEFDFESLAPLFVVLMYFYHSEKKIVPFYIAMILTALCKENLALIPIMFGMYSLFSKSHTKIAWGIIPILFGTLYFSLVMFVIMPQLRHAYAYTNNIYFGLYSNFGNSPQNIVLNLLTHPMHFLQLIFDAKNQHYLQELFCPLLATSILAPQVLFLALPIFMQNLLSSAGALHTIYFHYTTVLAIFIFLASIEGIAWLQKFLRPFFVKILVVFICIVTLTNLMTYKTGLLGRIVLTSPKQAEARREMIKKIPKEEGIIASFSNLLPLTNRQSLYAFYNVWIGINGFKAQKFTLPPNVNYAFLDLADPWLIADLDAHPQKTQENLSNFFSNENDWRIIDSTGNIVLLQKRGNGVPIFERYPHLYGIKHNPQQR